ncbi:MAG TPA: hypothetical protein VN976_21780 [Verrucomicrobiae bacterium]|nr:hypothetical protein [Verrucomicrobiae bacterium]
MTEKPRTFEEWWDSQTEQFRRTHSASDYFGGWDARDEEVAAKDRRIAALEASWRCFFCGETFTDRHEAWLHFGEENCTSDVPACVDPLRADEKARLSELREAVEEAQKARNELAKMEDFQGDYEAFWSEIRCCFGEDCNSVWLAGDRYKSVWNLVVALQAQIDRVRALAKEVEEIYLELKESGVWHRLRAALGEPMSLREAIRSMADPAVTPERKP